MFSLKLDENNLRILYYHFAYSSFGAKLKQINARFRDNDIPLNTTRRDHTNRVELVGLLAQLHISKPTIMSPGLIQSHYYTV